MDTMTNFLMKLYLKNWKIPLAQLGGQILRLITSRGRHLTTLKVSDLFKVNMNMLNIFWANTVKFFNYILDTCQNLGDNSAKECKRHRANYRARFVIILISNGINYKSDYASFWFHRFIFYKHHNFAFNTDLQIENSRAGK